MAQDRLTGKSFSNRSVVMAQHGMAYTSHPPATEATINILRKGGSAVYAAIAANAVLGVTNSGMNGIRGYLFAIVYDAKIIKLYGLHASGRSFYSLLLDTLKKDRKTFIPTTGPLSVFVPGCVDGWFQLHERYDKLKMSQIITPAINYARNGTPVADETAYMYSEIKDRFGSSPNVAQVFITNSSAPKRDDVFKNPQLANSLDKIVKFGKDVFYKGNMAKCIDAFI